MKTILTPLGRRLIITETIGAMKSEYDSMYPHTELTKYPFRDLALARFAQDTFNKVDKRPGKWDVIPSCGAYRVHKTHYPHYN